MAHLYQLPEIQAAADFVGDSLELAKAAKNAGKETIVFCGVYFMAETAKLLNPEAAVLLPAANALCPMAEMVTPCDVRRLRAQNPGAAAVCYINSTAAVKAECDICCTSSNALKVAASLENNEIIFVPDKNLGRYVASRLPEKRFIFHDGFCPAHGRVTPDDILKARAEHPGAPVLSHPECSPEVLALSDYVGSTAQIIKYAHISPENAFIIVTERGISYRLGRLCPEKSFFFPANGLFCPNMKKISLISLVASLEKNEHKIEIDENTSQRALRAIERMLRVK